MENNDSYDEWNKKENSKFKRIFKNINPIQFIAFIGFLCIGYSMVSKGTVSRETFFLFLGGMLVVMIFFIMKDGPNRKVISERAAKEISQAALEYKKNKGLEISSDSQVKVMQACQLIYEMDYTQPNPVSVPIKWEIGFQVTKNGNKKTGVISIHPYDGTVLGYRYEPSGYTGRESKDRIIIPMKSVDEQK